MRIRRRSRSEKLLERIGELPWWQRAAPLAVPAFGAAVFASRRRIWQGMVLVASAVEDAANTVKAPAARKRAGTAQT